MWGKKSFADNCQHRLEVRREIRLHPELVDHHQSHNDVENCLEGIALLAKSNLVRLFGEAKGGSQVLIKI
jgi:hypothetical protein